MTIENAVLRLGAIIFLLWAALSSMAGAAQPQLTREQASRALASPDAATRRAAASRLGEIGRMSDVAALVKVLRDRDDETRAVAEAAVWGIWARADDAGSMRFTRKA